MNDPHDCMHAACMSRLALRSTAVRLTCACLWCGVQENDKFLLFASDGVWEFITSAVRSTRTPALPLGRLTSLPACGCAAVGGAAGGGGHHQRQPEQGAGLRLPGAHRERRRQVRSQGPPPAAAIHPSLATLMAGRMRALRADVWLFVGVWPSGGGTWRATTATTSRRSSSRSRPSPPLS